MSSTKWAGLFKQTSNPTIKHLIEEVLPLAEQSASKELITSLEKSLELESARVNFTRDVTTKHSETGAKVETKTFSNDWKEIYRQGKTTWDCNPAMISGEVTGQFLKSVVSAVGAKDILEVGMFTGYTAIIMAEALPDVGKVVTIDRDQYFKEIVEDLIKDSRHKHKLDIRIGMACDLMTKMCSDGNSFDVVFLDAAKEEYPAYLKLCLEGKLLKPNGLIMADNAYTLGQSYLTPDGPGGKFADLIKNDPNLHVVTVPIKDGIFFIQRRSDVDGGVA